MSDKPGIPAWQRTASPASPAAEHEPAPEQEEKEDSATFVAEEATTTTESEDEATSSSLLEQASRFLEDPTIRDAPREKKVAFLQSKNVAPEDIETLLETVEDDASIPPVLEQAGERAWSSAPPNPTEAPTPIPQPREIPPIVTYPEFLAQTEKQPPLITTQRLLNTAYVAGGVMATIYGFSKFILAPMTQNLTESRHDFAAHTHEQLKEFNKKLGGLVSVDPATLVKAKPTDVADDVSEADSDPTELYHRDYGTQTTPNLSRRPSHSSGSDAEPTVTAHENRLKKISAHLTEITANRTNNRVSADSLKTKVSDLTTYLSEMSYQNQYYSSSNSFYSSSFSLSSGKDGKNDQIEVLKNDIRAVKGVFLSARNFPVGGRSVSPMPTGRAGAGGR